jgi:hypothetical protein
MAHPRRYRVSPDWVGKLSKEIILPVPKIPLFYVLRLPDLVVRKGVNSHII